MIEKDPQNHSSHECPPYQFYGVRKGKAVRACVFLFWSDCKAQVDGYDGAEYAGPFGDFHDAVIFAAMRQSKDNSISCTSSLSVKSDLTINTKEEKVEKIEADANKVSLPMIRVTEEDKSNSGDGTTSAKKKLNQIQAESNTGAVVITPYKQKNASVENHNVDNNAEDRKKRKIDASSSEQNGNIMQSRKQNQENENANDQDGDNGDSQHVGDDENVKRRKLTIKTDTCQLPSPKAEEQKKADKSSAPNFNTNTPSMSPTFPQQHYANNFQRHPGILPHSTQALHHQLVWNPDGSYFYKVVPGPPPSIFVSPAPFYAPSYQSPPYTSPFQPPHFGAGLPAGSNMATNDQKTKLEEEQKDKNTPKEIEKKSQDKSLNGFPSGDNVMTGARQKEKEVSEQEVENDTNKPKESDKESSSSKGSTKKLKWEWMKRYNKLKAHYDEHGGFNTDSMELALRIFMTRQRTMYKQFKENKGVEGKGQNNGAVEEKIRLLQEIQFDFESESKQDIETEISSEWMDCFDQMKVYFEKKVTFDTLSHKVASEKKLLNFMWEQRAMYHIFHNNKNKKEQKLDLVSKEKIRLLKQINFDFYDGRKEERDDLGSDWMSNYEKLKLHHERQGDVNDLKSIDKSVVKFIREQRKMYRTYVKNSFKNDGNENLADVQEKIKLLKQINLKFDPLWKAKFEQLKAFVQEHKHCKIPTDNGLRHWVNMQKNEYGLMKAGKPTDLDATEYLRLANLGMNWEKRRKLPWDERFEQLCEYKKEHSHVNIPLHHPTLGRFVQNLRAEFKSLIHCRKSWLNEERVKQLTELGFVFQVGEYRVVDYETKTWDQRFQDLIQFKEKYGHTRVPQQYKADRQLGEWVHRQRRGYKAMKRGIKMHGMATEKALKLAEVGFIFDCSNDRWKRLESPNASECESV